MVVYDSAGVCGPKKTFSEVFRFMAQAPQQLDVCKAFHGGQVSTLARDCKHTHLDWELLNPVNASALMETLAMNSTLFLAFLEEKDKYRLTICNFYIGETTFWLTILNGQLDVATKLPMLKTCNSFRLVEREMQRQTFLEEFKINK